MMSLLASVSLALSTLKTFILCHDRVCVGKAVSCYGGAFNFAFASWNDSRNNIISD